jgi:hypothetical protein
LAGGIPYLKFHPLAVKVDCSDLEVYPNGRDETGSETVLAEAQQAA